MYLFQFAPHYQFDTYENVVFIFIISLYEQTVSVHVSSFIHSRNGMSHVYIGHLISLFFTRKLNLSARLFERKSKLCVIRKLTPSIFLTFLFSPSRLYSLIPTSHFSLYFLHVGRKKLN